MLLIGEMEFVMPFAKWIISLPIVFALYVPAHAQMKAQVGSPPPKPSQSPKGAGAGTVAKAELIKQHQQLSDEYNAIKLKTAKYAASTAAASAELKKAQAEMSADMLAAESLLKESKNELDSDPASKIPAIQKKLEQLKAMLKELEEIDKKIAALLPGLVEEVGSDPTPPSRRKP
jgi:septal ring factor EnvC (AmiA/AmiB activator)